jgi:putative cell wall-binding protein
MRILHDMRDVKMSNPVAYNFYGGDLMYNWGKNAIQMDAAQIKNSKEATKIANDISGLSGERQNASIKKHSKNTLSPKVGINMVSKPNSEKYTNAGLFSAKSTKLFEQVNRIKKLMI